MASMPRALAIKPIASTADLFVRLAQIAVTRRGCAAARRDHSGIPITRYIAGNKFVQVFAALIRRMRAERVGGLHG